MPFVTATVSLQGNRKLNQDRYAVLRDGDSVLLLLSDGMGGHPRGEVAAQIVVDTGRAAFETTSKPIGDPSGFLDDLLKTAHEQIVAYGRRQHPPVDPRATAVAVLVQNGTACWVHAGDSRAYLFRDYRVVQRTRDHSFVEQLHGRGILAKTDPKAKRYRNLVTQCLGGSGMRFGTSRGRPIRLRRHDILLLCSDGLWSQLPEGQLGPRMRHRGSLERMASELARDARQAAAPSSDNITLVALRWHGEDEERASPPETEADHTGNEKPTAAEPDRLQDAIELLRSAIEDYEAGSQ